VQKSVQNCVISVQNATFLTKLFWGQAPRPPTGDGTAPPLRSSNYPPTFHQAPTPLVVAGWAVTLGTARRVLGGNAVLPSTLAVTNVTAHPSTASVPVSSIWRLITFAFNTLISLRRVLIDVAVLSRERFRQYLVVNGTVCRALQRRHNGAALHHFASARQSSG